MNKKNVAKYAFFAGLLEGDGCIGAYYNGMSPNHIKVLVRFDQKDGRVIDWLYGALGGAVRPVEGAKYGGVDRFRWDIGGESAARLLKRSLPYLHTKKRQAELAIRLQSRISHRRGNARMSDHEVTLRRAIVDELHHLKKVIVHSKVAAEVKRVAASNGDAMTHSTGNNELVGSGHHP